MSSLINLSFISITFLYFLFCDFNYLDYNIFQDIYCDGINDDQILDLNNRHIENSDNSPFGAMTTIRPGIENSDNSPFGAMTTIRPGIEPIENFSDVETIPDGEGNVDTSLRTRKILGIVILTVCGTVLVGTVVVLSVLSTVHSL
jgi:hypothetical protein